MQNLQEWVELLLIAANPRQISSPALCSLLIARLWMMGAASLWCYWEAAAVAGMIFGVAARHSWMNVAETLHTLCMCTLFIYYVYINAHTYSIYFENIYMYIHLYIYIIIFYIIYLIYKHSIFFLKGWSNGFFSKAWLCSCFIFKKSHYFSHILPVLHTAFQLT